MHARIVLDHTLFDEAALTKVLEPPVLYFSVFRPPDEMLRSMYTMAYFQWRHDGPNIRIKNGDGSFCQSLTSDNNNATRWLHGCPAATKQKGLIREYLGGRGGSVVGALAVITRGNFFPMLQKKYDESIVVLAKVANLSFADLLYQRGGIDGQPE